MAVHVEQFQNFSVNDRVRVQFTHTIAPGRIVDIIKGDGDYATIKVKMLRSGKTLSVPSDRCLKGE